MSRKSTPPPESRFLGDLGRIVIVWQAVVLSLWYLLGYGWILILSVPFVLYALNRLYGVSLLAGAWWRWRKTDIRGVLITSDSPKWKDYIEENWLPRFGNKTITLNWSERGTWRSTLPVRVFRFFGIFHDNFNYNPAVIYLRGLRFPYVYRFYNAFRDAKHGRFKALKHLEEHMFRQFDVAGG